MLKKKIAHGIGDPTSNSTSRPAAHFTAAQLKTGRQSGHLGALTATVSPDEMPRANACSTGKSERQTAIDAQPPRGTGLSP